MIYNLRDFVEVRAGHPFRGKIHEKQNGNSFVIQIRDIDEQHEVNWETLIPTDISGSKEPNWLQSGDILFTARGRHNVAAFIESTPVDVVAAQHIFILRIKSLEKILPEFLVWQINQKSAQNYFKINAEGSLQLSIRKSVLENLPIELPCIEKQRAIAGFYSKVKQEKRVLKALIKNREDQMQKIANNILS
ncbi:restriction endonuclease subunit S [Pseudoalteromonas sp. CAL260-MNA-CIBAN-0059]|uniref:restriction endonuclease subunit S n=1 Tax=unclassified Pseudoalteromonas TaxID=194690 RepID=UPI00332C8B2E|tara:strand:- start:523 stop:1095 length:573 start_codon:yes stop_codon:yes gene_type:complete